MALKLDEEDTGGKFRRRGGIADVGTVISLVRSSLNNPGKTAEVCGRTVSIKSTKLIVFLKKGTKCNHCGLEAEYFAVERSSKDNTNCWFLSLYGVTERRGGE